MNENIEYNPVDMIDYSCHNCGEDEPGWIDTGGVVDNCTVYCCNGCGATKMGCD